MDAARTSTFTVRILGWRGAGECYISVDQEPCTSVSFGTWGHVLPAHVREEFVRSYQRGFGVAQVFPFGVSVGSAGVEAALCPLPLDPENHLVLNRERLNTYEAQKEEIKGIIDGRVGAHIREVQECKRIVAKVETPWMLTAS